jgi:hypothetical protein
LFTTRLVRISQPAGSMQFDTGEGEGEGETVRFAWMDGRPRPEPLAATNNNVVLPHARNLALLSTLVYNVIVSGSLAAFRPASSHSRSSKRVFPSMQRVQIVGLGKESKKALSYKARVGCLPNLTPPRDNEHA